MPKTVLTHLSDLVDDCNAVRSIDNAVADEFRWDKRQTHKLAALDELKRSQLHQAFSGGLS